MSLDYVNQDNLLPTVRKLQYLVGMLLARSGLDQDGIEKAFELAEAGTKKLEEELMAHVAKKFQETPEGREASRLAQEEFLRRQQEMWREDCIEAADPAPTEGARLTG